MAIIYGSLTGLILLVTILALLYFYVLYPRFARYEICAKRGTKDLAEGSWTLDGKEYKSLTECELEIGYDLGQKLAILLILQICKIFFTYVLWLNFLTDKEQNEMKNENENIELGSKRDKQISKEEENDEDKRT